MDDSPVSSASVAVDEDDSSTDDETGESNEGNIQLGFVDTQKCTNDLFRNANWLDWDGGIVGGRPVWLNPNPTSLLRQSDLACLHCSDPMMFLLQIYCPLDEPKEAFHRSLYLFCCRKAACVDKGKGAVKCFRCQLPKENDYYPANPNPSSISSSSDTTEGKNDRYYAIAKEECIICGCYASNVCSRCKKIYYCSKTHQKDHWKSHKLYCGEITVQSSPSYYKLEQESIGRSITYPQYDLLVDEEVLDDVATIDKVDEIVLNANIWGDAMCKVGDEDNDKNVTQDEYRKALGNDAFVTDRAYEKFIERVRLGGADQVLRYCRWNDSGRILISAEQTSPLQDTSVPKCQRCGAGRKIEFQVLPQLLYFLSVDKTTTVAALPDQNIEIPKDQHASEKESLVGAFKNKRGGDIDWGIIDVFTCTKSCSVDCAAYLEEEVHIQPPYTKKAQT